MKHLLIIIGLVCGQLSWGQTPNIGLVYTSDSVTEGYTLFSPDDQGEIYLIDNCGRIINHWSFNEPPGLTSYLLDNGNLLIAGLDSLYIRDWNNNPIWTYAAADNGIRQHHDIEPLPNGNILCIVTENKSEAEQTAAGKDPAFLAANFKLDKIVELEPVGSDDANIVWEWHFWDHLIQEYDNTKLNFGVVADHPELLNFNFDQGNNGDWTHVNGIDYNFDLDQIVLSSRQFSEIYIIDHSTTSIEAASHMGGNSGKGGDFLWRWGNPQVYQQGSPADQKLFGQHDPKWIINGYVNEGMISTFNNGGDGTQTFSSIHLIDPTMNGSDYILTGGEFQPTNFNYTWNGNLVSPTLYSNKKSGVQGLPNGGFLICETSGGRFVEIHPDGSRVWQYINPLGFGGIYNQFDLTANGNNPAFRATKYMPDHPAFLMQSISAGTIIEDQNSLSDSCHSVAELSEKESFELSIKNPISNGKIDFVQPLQEGVLRLYTSEGKLVESWELNGQKQLDFKSNSNGVYQLIWSTDSSIARKRVLVISN